MTSENSPVSAESYSISRSLFGATLPSATAPKYHRLASFLLSTFIQNGEAHTPLPTERELQNQFGLSRDTVRRAISILQQRGLVYNVQGSGTYVADQHRHTKTPRLVSYTEDMVARGFTPTTATLNCHKVGASLKVASDLNIEESTPVIEVVRLRRADGAPMCYEKARFIPEAFAHVEPENSVSLDAQLTSSGFRIERVVQRIFATNLTAEEAAALDVPQGAAALRVERVGYTSRGTAVESTVSLYRADRFDYEIELTRDK
ncbi:MAG: GntR family transcriptional regulator [Rothia sp. (in: high G+C Gram-positive bacteria)]|nr:GntR family transcriptional regulator [Rothia sp. (in: high G+C Gram-positive bacteria)]